MNFIWAFLSLGMHFTKAKKKKKRKFEKNEMALDETSLVKKKKWPRILNDKILVTRIVQIFFSKIDQKKIYSGIHKNASSSFQHI